MKLRNVYWAKEVRLIFCPDTHTTGWHHPQTKQFQAFKFPEPSEKTDEMKPLNVILQPVMRKV